MHMWLDLVHNEMHDTSGGKGHIQVRVRVRVGISESHYGANQAIYKQMN